MSTTMKDLGLERLSVADRLRLAEELWDSIVAEPDAFSLSDAHRQDLRRRLDAYRDDPKAGSPWEVVRSRLLGSGG